MIQSRIFCLQMTLLSLPKQLLLKQRLLKDVWMIIANGLAKQ